MKLKQCPKVFVVVLNYNGLEVLKQCLSSVFRMDYPRFEVVVVDNNSSDGSVELVKNFFPKARFIMNQENLGFSAGNNVGIKFSLEKMADYIFLLNNDAVIEEKTVSQLVKAAEEKKEIGIAGPLVLEGETGNVWFAGGKIKWLEMKAVHLNQPLSASPYPTEYVSGCAMLIKKDVFREIGLLDEDFFLYYEDTDFCQRAKKKKFESLIVPGAYVYHFEKSEKNKANKIYWLVISGIIFFEKNVPKILKPWINFFLFLRKIKNWQDVRFKKDKLAEVVRKAYQDYDEIKNQKLK